MNLPRVQITLIQIDNYGPWTGTLGNDREHRLQVLQSDLYSTLQSSFSMKNGLVFFNRFDEMLAVTNGISQAEHREIQSSVRELFPFTVSMSIGVELTPFKAQAQASKMLHAAGSARSERRSGVLAVKETLKLDEAYAQIIHIDVDGITKISDHGFAFDTLMRLQRSYLDLMTLFGKLDSLLFYLGGDNFMAITPNLDEESVAAKLSEYSLNGLPLKFGSGLAQTARKAAELATMELEQVRHERDGCIVSPNIRENR